MLIIRGQPAVPTGLGQRLIVHHRNVKLMEASLDIDLGNSVSMPEIAIAIDADSLATWFPDTLTALLAPPRCQLDVRLADSDAALQMVRDGTVQWTSQNNQLTTHDCTGHAETNAVRQLMRFLRPERPGTFGAVGAEADGTNTDEVS